MGEVDGLRLAGLVLAASTSLVETINAGVRRRGFGDVRPAHGFAFSRLAPDGATVSDLAEHLGVSRQAASQLVDELVTKGYVRRIPHPSDARARLVVLTERGWACTQAADEAAADAISGWSDVLGLDGVRNLTHALAQVAPGGPLRPTW